MKMKFLYSLLMGALLMYQTISATSSKAGPEFKISDQGIAITGTVTDAEGLPLLGVNILEKGTQNGTVADFDGNFEINVIDDAAVLVFSSLGFVTKEVIVGGNRSLQVVLEEDAQQLDEVVVVGYGEVRASDATGAVSSIKAEDFNGGVIASPEQLIQGKSAGVQITSSSGEPGGGINIRIRGTGSIRSGNQPLFVIDGVPISGDNISDGGNVPGTGATAPKNPLNFMNPNDIASIDILKDASATAIYGSRGANGVVIITTKKGSGKGSLNYSYSIGMSEITQKYEVGNAQEFLTGYALVGGSNPDIDFGAETDWQDEILRTAISQTHELSYGGSNESGDYRFSFSHSDQQGIIKQNGLKRLTGRFNGNKKFLNDRVTVSTQLTISDLHDDNVPITDSSNHQGDIMAGAIKTNPTRPVYNPDGTFNQPSRDNPNPVAFLELSKDYSNTLKFLGSFSADVKLLDWLSFKTVYGIDRSMSTRKSAVSGELNATVVSAEENNGVASINSIEVDNVLWENYFTVNHDFKKLNLNAVIGYSYQQFEFSRQAMSAADFRVTDLDLMLNNMTAANLTAIQGTSKTVDELQSYFTRINLSYDEKYYLTSTVRIDGSTKFGSDHAYGMFPSLAFKWKLSQEDFIPSFFSNLSIRAGWGTTGNQDIPHNLYTRRQRYGSPSLNVQDGVVIPGGLGTVTFENQGLKWEETQQTSLGLEFGFMNNRLRGSLDFYNKTTTDMLVQLNAAEPAPQAFVWRNLDADVINRGIEVDLQYDIFDNQSFGWTIAGNASFNDNVVENFDFGFLETGSINGQGLSGINVERIQNGHPLYAFYVPSFDGFDSDGNAIYGEAGFTGDQPLPTATAALTNTLRLGNFDLNIFFNGQFGHSVYSNTANSFFHAPSVSSGRNATLEVLTGDERNTSSVNVSTRYLERADFVRLQDLTLGYRVNVGENSIFSSLRFFLTGQNLLTITGYSGQDPEVNTNRSDNGIPSSGIDYTSYPRARTFLLGANVSF